MTELNVLQAKVNVTHRCEFASGSRGNEAFVEILAYDKSEADAVIADLEESHKKEIEQLLIEIVEQKRLRDMALASVPNVLKVMKIIQRHKYKRCLAMEQEWRNYATVCGMQSHCHNHRGFGKTAEKYTWKEIHAWRCRNRWLKISEQFKESK